MAIIRRLAMARLRPDASPGCRPWQDIAPMRSRAAGRGKISPRCVPEGASDGENTGSRQHIACMHSDSANFGKICVLCVQKRPAERRWGMHRANILPPRGAFAVRSPQIMHGARILPPSGGPAPAQGLLPEQLHRGIAFQLPGPCAGVPTPSASPIPATCQCLPLAVPVAARDKPPMSFGGGHPAHGLQSGRAPRGRRLRHLNGRADNGMLRRTGPGFQNREQVGAEPPAEAAGPAGPAAALPKTPIERTSPSWRNYRNTPSEADRAAAPTRSFAAIR